MHRECTFQEKVENSIRKTFHSCLYMNFVKACNTYELVKDGDSVAVCISGGKDSFLLAKLFQEMKRFSKINFELTFLVMNPGYSKENVDAIKLNAAKMGIPITIFESDIFERVDNMNEKPCFMCSRLRRGYLYKKAKESGCNKIAFGHHYDDVIETILMGIFYSGQFQTMMPKIVSEGFEGMELIRPMYFIREKDICRWRDYNNLKFLQCACRLTENTNDGQMMDSKRQEIKKLIAALKVNNPYLEQNIFKSAENVNLNAVISYKKDWKRYHFMDESSKKSYADT